MIRRRSGVILVALVALLAGCRSILLHQLETDVRYGAVLYAEELKNRDELPGIDQGDHGDLILDNPGRILIHAGVEYPLEVVVRARKSDDAEKAEYAYRMLKSAPDKQWVLIGACKRVKGKNVWYRDLQNRNPQSIAAPLPSAPRTEPSEGAR